jgi:outer membrane beta-barrel protein
VRNLLVLSVLMLSTAQAWGGGPTYPADPFGDADFAGAPLILDVAHPSRGRGDLSLLYSQSVIDKYTAHKGLMLQFEYAITDTFGVAFAFGFNHGQLTNIVTDDLGIIGNKVKKCIDDHQPDNCDSVEPDVPDYTQMTGIVDALAVWQPLYGKINVVSELDVNLQAYVLAGVGVNGRRRIDVEIKGVSNGFPVVPSDYKLSGGDFGQGGLFGDPKPHFTAGAGLQVFLLNWLSLKAEVRGYISRETFKFIYGEQSYFAQYWFFQTGLGFILF